MPWEPIAVISADRAVQSHVLSARPDAPVVPDRPRGATRRRAAAALRRVADRLEPVRVVRPSPAS
jgi:hypothetical protein